MLDNHYDFVISGAGLVGCVITKQLDALGYDVCLVEKSKLDKRKEETILCSLDTTLFITREIDDKTSIAGKWFLAARSLLN